MIKETPWRRFIDEYHQRNRIRVQYGIDYAFARRNNQAPYFSITGDTQIQARNNRWMDSSAGAIHGLIAAHYRQFAPYLKWHLVGTDGPTHYLANAMYYFEMAQGKRENPSTSTNNPLEAFRHTIVYPGFPGDEAPPEIREDLEEGEWRPPAKTRYRGPKEWTPRATARTFFQSARWEDVEAWLEDRLPALQAAWVVDMGELGVLEDPSLQSPAGPV